MLVEGEDILGDGVNIAARLEGVAEPGGVCISASAFDHVRGRIEAEFIDLGEKSVKNIARPVRVYAVRIDSDRAPRAPRSAPPKSGRLACPSSCFLSPTSAATRSRIISSMG